VREERAATIGVYRGISSDRMEPRDVGRSDVLELQRSERRDHVQSKVSLVLLDTTWFLVGLGILFDVASSEFSEGGSVGIGSVDCQFRLPLVGRIDLVRHPPE